jgi:tRNA dimethylallyltransferase
MSSGEDLAGVVLAVFGPTASGKTAVAEAIAERVPAELVSADAMQVYRGLPILTNQSPKPARLVAIWPLSQTASVAAYAPLAHRAIDAVLAGGRTPVVVGGTGLYLRAALAELDVPPPPRPGVRERFDALYSERGAEAAHAELAHRDPAAAEHVHPNDRRRVVRALELAEAGSSLHPRRDTLWAAETRHPTLIFGLDVPRDELVARIEARTRSMFEQGVEDEVRRALAGPVSPTAMMIHGLRDVADLPREQAIEAYNRRVRRYAAYQRKWMRRIPGITIVRHGGDEEATAHAILEMARARQRVPDRAP